MTYDYLNRIIINASMISSLMSFNENSLFQRVQFPKARAHFEPWFDMSNKGVKIVDSFSQVSKPEKTRLDSLLHRYPTSGLLV